jgi:hypothetical protein
MHFALTQSAKRLMDDAVAGQIPSDLLVHAASTYYNLSELARQLDLIASRPTMDEQSVAVAAAVIAEGLAPQMADEPEPEPRDYSGTRG